MKIAALYLMTLTFVAGLMTITGSSASTTTAATTEEERGVVPAVTPRRGRRGNTKYGKTAVAPEQTNFDTASYVSPCSHTIRHDDTCQVIRNCSTRWQEQEYSTDEIHGLLAPNAVDRGAGDVKMQPSQWLDWIKFCSENQQDNEDHAPQKKMKPCSTGNDGLIPEKMASSCTGNCAGVQADAEIIYNWIDKISRPGFGCDCAMQNCSPCGYGSNYGSNCCYSCDGAFNSFCPGCTNQETSP